MTAHSRQPAGVPTGGQFAAGIHTEATGVALADVEAVPTAADVDEALHRGVLDMIDLLDGTTTENVIDLLDHDEDRLVAAFGEGPVNWLAGLKVTADVDSWETAKATYIDPAEWSSGGSVRVEDGDGKVVAEVNYSGEDAPELPDLLRRCPVDANGRPLADPSDPGWDRIGNGTGAIRASEWRRCGFHTPDAALEWRGAGFVPEVASQWDGAGFSPAQARSFRSDGVSVGSALHLRRQAEKAAAGESLPAPATATTATESAA
jgi:hypothetical protein